MPYLRLKNQKIECELIIFDLSDTLINTKPRFYGLARSRARTLEDIAGRKAVERWAEASGVSLDTWKYDELGPLAKASRREDLIVAATALYASGYEWQKAKELAADAYKKADELLIGLYRPSLFDGVEKALRRLKKLGFKLAVATNDRNEVAEKSLKETGVRDLFNAVVGADDVENPKPSPDMILLACKRCEVSPEMTILVGDSSNDMKAGIGACIKYLIAVSPGLKPSSDLIELANIHIESVNYFQKA